VSTLTDYSPLYSDWRNYSRWYLAHMPILHANFYFNEICSSCWKFVCSLPFADQGQIWHTGVDPSAVMGIGFQPPYPSIPTEKPMEIPQNPYTHRTPKILQTHTSNLVCFRWMHIFAVFPVYCMSIGRYLNKHIYAVHVLLLLCVFSNDNEQKNASKTNYKLDCIWRNSNSD